MKHLNKENINKNQVETVEQFKVLLYLENTFNLDEIELYLYDKSTIKLIDKNKVQAYFKYDKQTKKVQFYETYIIFVISKVIEMDSIEQNRVALYLFNSINYEIKNYKTLDNTKQMF